MSGMVQSLDPAEMACWRAFIESSQLLMTQLEDDLRETSELTFADYHVLVLLSEAPRQRLRMGELAGKLIFSPSRLTYHIGTMERRGLVVREPCPEDRRGSEAVLTAAGLLALRDAAPAPPALGADQLRRRPRRRRGRRPHQSLRHASASGCVAARTD